jgi:uncharacterized protein with HEPN domain
MRRDDAFLLDMLIAARDAVSFLQGMSAEQFGASRMLSAKVETQW